MELPEASTIPVMHEGVNRTIGSELNSRTRALTSDDSIMRMSYKEP